MARNPLHDVAIVGVHNTVQARVLEGHTSESITAAAVAGVLEDAGLSLADVDGFSVGGDGRAWIYQSSAGPAWHSARSDGIPQVAEAALAIAGGLCDVAVVAAGSAGVYTERESTAPWTRPANEFVVPWGLFTTAEFALIARRHMHQFGTTPMQLATVAATIRNNGHVHPDAVYHGRGPYTPDDILASRMVADPFHLLDCAMTSEGGAALLLTRADRAAHLRRPPVFILGAATDCYGSSYRHPPSFDLTGRLGDAYANGWAGRRAAERSFAACGLGPDDVDVCELYDPFSFEIIRQLEAFGFCPLGEGGPFVADGGVIGPGGRFPITTDGGLMSFSHGGATVQLLQRVIRSVQQLRRECATNQVPGAEVAICSNGGAGALFTDVMLLGSERP